MNILSVKNCGKRLCFAIFYGYLPHNFDYVVNEKNLKDGVLMRLSEVQETMDKFFKDNSITVVLMQFSKILTLFYPIYLVLSRLSFLNFLTDIIGIVSIVFYFTYLVGLILSFAKNDMFTVAIAFGIKSILNIIDLFVFSVHINSIISIVVYALIAVAAFNCYKNNTDI